MMVANDKKQNGYAPEWSLPDELADKITELPTTGWKPKPGDALYDCVFEKAGFRAYRLTAKDSTWSLVLSKVDVGKNDPRGVLSVYAPSSDAAFGDLDGLVMTRSIALLGATSIGSVTKMLNKTIGVADMDWQRRFDYLVARTLRAAVQGRVERFTIDGPIGPLAPSKFVFDRRLRMGRTISIFGAGSGGKTTLVNGLVVSLGTGKEIIPNWLPTRPFRVAVLDYDEGSEEELVRLAAMTRFYGMDIKGYFYSQMTRPLAEQADEVGPLLLDHGAEVLVLSNVNAALRKDSHGGDAGSPVHELYECLREFGTTNILIDHVAGMDIQGGAMKEYGSVAKVNNARGSYLIEERKGESVPGRHVVRIINRKPDALSPKRPEQGIQIIFSPPWSKPDGSYDLISFEEAEAVEDVVSDDDTLRNRLYAALANSAHLTVEELAHEVGSTKANSIRTILNRNKLMFNHLSSGRWERLPMA